MENAWLTSQVIDNGLQGFQLQWENFGGIYHFLEAGKAQWSTWRVGNRMNEGLVRDRFFLPRRVFYQNQGDSDTSNFEGVRFSGRNLYRLHNRLGDDGADLSRDGTYRNTLKSETRQFYRIDETCQTNH